MGRNRIEAFGRCGEFATVHAATVGPEDYCIRGSNCHDRFCQPCASARSFAVAQRLAGIAGDKPLLFITVTLRNRRDEKLRDQLDRLYEAFRNLRRLTFWEKSIAGGCAVCEVKRTKKHCWHAHLHILAEGTYLDARQLSQIWKGITGDSWKVDVQRVGDLRGAVAEVSKYAGKPMESGFWREPSLLQEAILALRGRRLIVQFGTWYNPADLLDDEEGETLFDDDPRQWSRLCTLSQLHRIANAGNAAAARVLALCRVRDPLDGTRPTQQPPPLREEWCSRTRADMIIHAIKRDAAPLDECSPA